MIALALAALIGTAPAPAARDAGECARDKRCWKLVLIGFREILPSHTRMVDGALPNEYFPHAVTFALPGVQKGTGRFLFVRCDDPKKPGKRVACPEKTVALERRVLAASLVAALPLGRPAEELFDSRFLLSTHGLEALGKVEQARPDFWAELTALLPKALGESEKGLPEALLR